jgi:glycosyltransferase involved in cell wall biosynthesis
MTVDRITFVIPTLTSGGAERVLTTMANHWSAQNLAVTVLTLAAQGDPPFYPLAPSVQRVGLGKIQPARTPLHAAINNAGRLFRLRQAIRAGQPDVVISFLDQTNVLTLLATRGLNLAVVVSEHTDPGLAQRHRVWDQLRTLLYPRADRVVVLSESSKSYFPSKIQSKTQIIPNPIQVDCPAAPIQTSSRPQVTAMGRFGPEKGFDRLIDAFSQIAADFPGWDLVIWGDGVLRPDLTDQRDRLGLSDRILLPGRTQTPHVELRKASIYALTSHREGFPMALAEAMACGLPAVAFDLPSGPRDIIRDGIDGELVPNGDIAAFAEALASLMRDTARRRQMAERAPDVLDRFGVEHVMAIWEDLLEELTTTR